MLKNTLIHQSLPEPWRQQRHQQQEQQQGNPPPSPPDNHRPIRELRYSQGLRQSLIHSEGTVDHYYNDPAGNCT